MFMFTEIKNMLTILGKIKSIPVVVVVVTSDGSQLPATG
jgi:hypothetical protein